MPLSRIAPALALIALVATACSSGGQDKGSPVLANSSAPAGLAGVGTLPTPSSAWPEAGYDARMSSGSRATGPQTAHVRWQAPIDGNATPGPVIETDGSILAATNSGFLYDLDAHTGKTIWRFDGHGSYGSDLSTSPAVLTSGLALWPGPNDTLFAISPAGRLVWQHQLSAQVLSPAVAGRDRVYVADLKGQVVALDSSGATPRVVWQLEVGGSDYASPSVGPDGTIYTADDHELVAIRDLGARGIVRWRLRAAEMVEVSNPVAPDGTVVLGTNGDREYGIDPQGGVRWKHDIGDNTYSSAVATAAGLAYFGDNNGHVFVINTRTGALEHDVKPANSGGKEDVWSAVVVDAKGDFYWGSTRGNVYGYRPDGTQLWTMNVGTQVIGYPALGADGTLYVTTTAGRVIAIG